MVNLNLPHQFDPLKLVGEYSKRYANLPDRYIKRSMERVYWRTPKGPNYTNNRKHERKEFDFSTLDRPWTNNFKVHHSYGQRHRFVHVEPIAEWSWFRGDRVEVLVGKDKGKQGIIKQIFQERNWVIVEGLNAKLKIVGKTEEYPGTAMLQEKPLLVTTDIKLVDPSDFKPAEFEWRFSEHGERVRVSLRTGRVIPVPASHDETIDYKQPESYREGDKDTPKKLVEEVTFKPELKTFEMDIMQRMGIKEDRIRAPTYWY